MSIVAERRVRRVWAGLAEEVERQIEEDDARGPEPEPGVVTRTVLPGSVGWAGVSSAPPRSVLPGADELRVRMLLCRVLGVVA